MFEWLYVVVLGVELILCKIVIYRFSVEKDEEMVIR